MGIEVLCWDTEIVFPGKAQPELEPGASVWDLWPFGISVIGEATLPNKKVYVAKDKSRMPYGGPGKAMSPGLVHKYLLRLADKISEGHKVFAHNGVNFDWQLLARITGEHALCASLCLQSYDLCFQAICTLGYPIGLNSIARAVGSNEKEMEGGDAPSEWHAGNYDDVIRYVSGDVKRLRDVILYIFKTGALTWYTRAGIQRSISMPRLLTVEQCLELPLPDTSWMTDPISREDNIAWMLP